MIKFSNISQANFNALQFVAQGDGTSTVLKMNLTSPPFNVNFAGTRPSNFTVDLGDPDLGIAVASIQDTVDGDIMTITFVQAPPATETVGVNITCSYNSL